MPDYVLAEAERRLLQALNDLGVRYIVVGMSAALMQGARGATDDIDLWFEQLDDPRIGEATRSVGGIWISGSFGMRPPGIGGAVLGDRFDVVVHMHGLGAFTEEFAETHDMQIDDVRLRVLDLERIIVSKRSANRPKDQAQLPALEEALAVKRSLTED